MAQEFTEKTFKELANILGATDNAFSKTELKELLRLASIPCVDDGSRNLGYGISLTGNNKRTWLFECFINDHEKTHSDINVKRFIEIAFSPTRFTTDDRRGLYDNLFREINKLLLLYGIQVRGDGKLIAVEQAKTLDEVDMRVNRLQSEMRKRGVHPCVIDYCRKDILRNDYYSIVFESAKSLAERVRIITGLTTDGGTLFQEAFSSKNPLLFFNTLQTDSECSEFRGLRELLESIFHLVRNPAAHTPKINWKIDEAKTLDVLSLISFAHKYLDECRPMPKL